MTYNYKNPRLRNEDVKEHFEEKYNKHLSRCRETLEIFLEMLEVLKKQHQSMKQLSHTVLHALMIQSFNDFWSAILLCSHGYALSASSQLRNTISRLIDSKYIVEGDTEILCERWSEFINFQLEKQIKKVGKNKTLISKEKREEIFKGARAYIGKYDKHHDWSGRSLAGKAKTTELNDEYALYSYLSDMAHSNVIGSDRYYLGDGRFRIGPQDELIESILYWYGKVFLKQVQIWKEYFGLDLNEQETKLTDIWGDL